MPINMSLDINKINKNLQLIKSFNDKNKFQLDSNILAFPETGQSNCLSYVWHLHCFPASEEDKL